MRTEPGFVAGWLSATPDGERQIQDDLALSNASLHRLLTCRAPQPQRFTADVSAIAAYVDVDPTALAASLRAASVRAALRAGEPVARPRDAGLTGMLAAARDTAAEQLPEAESSTAVREFAEATWQAAPADVRARRDVQAAIIWAAPVIVVSLPRLRLELANQWLATRGVPPLADGAGELRGLLVAWRGHAAIFVDGTLPEDERRLTLAHENGHLWLDYLVPRQRVLRDAPDLLDVLDGHRPPSNADRARAALARLPLGLHTHLLHRHDDGAAPETTMQAEDAASGYALELLAPWTELIELLQARLSAEASYRDRLAAATEAVQDSFGLPPDAAAVRARTGLTALGIRPGFFDR